MQSLTAPPRDGLTEAQVRQLLVGDVVTVSAGAERLNSQLEVQEDISDDLVGGTVSRQMLAEIHGDFQLQLSRELDWAHDLVQLYMTLSEPSGITARFNVGVAVLTTPDRSVGDTPATFNVQGYDRIYLLRRPVGDSYSVTAGTPVLGAVAAAFTAAGISGVLIDGTSADKTLPADMVWPLVATGTDGVGDATATTWLNVINQLLASIGYRGVWVDERGYFRCDPYLNPTSRPAEFTFTVDDVTATIVGDGRTISVDQWNQPNRWVFVQQNRPFDAAGPTEGDGIYTVDRVPAGELPWASQVLLDAADQPSLQAQGDRVVANDTQRTTTLQLATAPFPVAGHFDVFGYVDSDVPDVRKAQAVDWTLPLDGSDMTWTWTAVA